MKIILTLHLKQRLLDRRISSKTVKNVVLKPDKRYLDLYEGSIVAVKKVMHNGRMKEMCVFFHYEGTDAKIHTVHPAGNNEIVNRIKLGRYEKYEKK